MTTKPYWHRPWANLLLTVWFVVSLAVCLAAWGYGLWAFVRWGWQ